MADTVIAVTGATGRVGSQTIEAFDDADLRLFSHSPSDEVDAEPIEIADREAFVGALDDDVDVLIHLAANPSPTANWEDLAGPNVDGLYNAFEAALEHDLRRVVFASSNHAVNAGNTVSPPRVESTVGRPEVVRPDDSPDPDSYYGVTKVLGEAMGDYYAHRHGLDVVNLRIGWLLSREELRTEVADRDGAGERYASAMWLSPEDCRRLMRAAATTPLATTPVVAHGISRNTDRFLSLAETVQSIGYRPADDAAEALDGEDESRDGLESV